jgi:hypothetical protein
MRPEVVLPTAFSTSSATSLYTQRDEILNVCQGRHGQGRHNVAESHYGSAAWDDQYVPFVLANPIVN